MFHFSKNENINFLRKTLKKKRMLANGHNHHLSNILGALRVAQLQKKISFKYWPCSNFVISVLCAIREEGYISGYTMTFEKNAR